MCRRRALLASLGVLGSAAALGAGALLEGCASGTTGGHRVLLHTRLELASDPGASFTTALGWNVTVSKALLATGALAYFDGTPPSVQQTPHRNWRFAQRLLGLGVAQAHPGHYGAGDARGEMLENYSADLLAGPLDLPDGEGITGTYRSARFSFHAPPAGPFATELEGHVALVEGLAEKAGEAPRFFRAAADLADLAANVSNGQVDGCEFTPVDVGGDGTVIVLVHLDVWFNLVAFDELEASSLEAPSDFPADSQPRLAFAQGLTQLSAYEFSYQPSSKES